MILVTGATGTVGSLVAHRLAPRHRVRLLTRRPDRITVTGPYVEIAQGDYADKDSLRRALYGVRTAFLVTTPVAATDDALFLAEARAAGVRHVVKLSAAAVQDVEARDLITRWQRTNEELLRESGLAWTLLRPRAFMSNTLSWRTSVCGDGTVRALHGTSANACVDPRDVAEVAVRALTAPGHAYRAYTLTGPRAIAAVEQTAILADVLQRPLRFEELALEEAREALLRRYPEPIARALLESAGRQQDGAKVRVADTVRQVTGHPPRSYETWAFDHRHAFSRARSPASRLALR
ncbi:NAD(P)-dependent oxidoreductase [Streptomyces sp. Ru71]|uniref:NAD(P)H-binding protein n=1 Tax=Streptomyces sp. Ru71 TaxID=2080746 RepID=UPI000CDCFE7A|nr:NAD(P)H-binding protein [Streptomyces sp. Ru71]POX56992.1 NAD(P)-dependent oxidoreductase [Streptomyces sp. Ru71]